MLRYHVGFYMPRSSGEMVIAEALDFPGAVSQGFDLADARAMITNALEELGQVLLEQGKPLPLPAINPDPGLADFVELIPLSVFAGTSAR